MSAGQGRASRYGIGVMVAVSSVLALVALLAVNWLAGRPGIRARWDLTRAEQNTLSTAAGGVVERLRDDVTIDILFRPEEYPLTDVARVAQMKYTGERRDVRLKKRVPVYFAYLTAWATRDGTVRFRRDLYRRDGVGLMAGSPGQGALRPRPPLHEAGHDLVTQEVPVEAPVHVPRVLRPGKPVVAEVVPQCLRGR